MINKDFTSEEQLWLKRNPKIAKEIYWAIDDLSNVDPLEDGSPDLKPFELAVKCSKFTIDLSQKKLLHGPYDNIFGDTICKEFPELKSESHHKFWNFFSISCIDTREEENVKSDEAIFLYSLHLTVTFLLSDDENFEFSDNDAVFDMDLNIEKKLIGRGLNATYK